MDNKVVIKAVRENSKYYHRENGETHTPYRIETAFYKAVSKGNITLANKLLNEIFEKPMFIGKLSDDPVKQMKYFSICSVTLATRYAIEAGLNETEAYHFADECILSVDKLKTEAEIMDYLFNQIQVLVDIINKCKENRHSNIVLRCLSFISDNLHSKLNLEIIAKEFNLSADYLSRIFKKETRLTIPQYIRKERLEEAKGLIISGMSIPEAGYVVGFNSESHFIKCFREEFGMTPGKLK